jgi:RNA polymerase sigma-70 factor (ECF subfamily)
MGPAFAAARFGRPLKPPEQLSLSANIDDDGDFLVANCPPAGTYGWRGDELMSGPGTNTIDADADLVDRVRQGNLAAYETLVDRYERLVLAAAMHVLRDRHAAEDAAQDAFLAAFASLAALRDASKFGPWLLAIARNQAAHAVRSRVRAEVCIPDIEAVESREGSELADGSQRLLEFVERLPDHERIVIGLRYFDGHTVEEVAAIAGRPVGTVTKQLSRAHARLQRWLNQEIRQ